jgi:leucyl-tRNA synthetase
MSTQPGQPTPQGSATDDAPAFRYSAALAGELEAKWQGVWAQRGTFKVANPGERGFDPGRPKFYCLDMFPYPSGAGLHVGHPEGYTATDIICRYKRMCGFNVLHPMGWDAFGLPAEQYAIATGVHPAITTREAIDNFRRQLQRFGFCYDWSREVGTIDPGYYRWTQWVFLKLYDAWFDPSVGRARAIGALAGEFARGERAVAFNPQGAEVSEADKARTLGPWGALDEATRRAVVDSYRLAYQGTTTVNWCPKLGTVLANDEVIDGKSERGGHPVLRKPLKQWMLRITAYAQRLLDQLDGLEWPESTKTIQREWIGRSEGAEVEFALVGRGELGGSLVVFTTRPDTIFGATYMVVAPEHPLVQRVVSGGGGSGGGLGVAEDVRAALAEYVQAAKNKSDVERQETKAKTGAFTGVYATNPATQRPIPVWVADYVLMGYGTGAIMAVPAHDERDYEFAKAFGLHVVEVVRAPEGTRVADGECFSGEGVSVNSGGPELDINGLATEEAKAKVIAWLERTGRGKRRVNFKLRDWTFSRQRYWGEPFPVVFDDAGNHSPVGEGALPVVLPELADYAPIESDDPMPLLAKAGGWVRTTAGAAGVDAALLDPGTPVTRECNTMPGSAGSSWYFLRYCDPANAERLIDPGVDAYWMKGGVDLYMGGPEHAVGHLLYARFWSNVLADLGVIGQAEPFRRLFHQGMITSYAYQRADKTIIATDLVREVSEGVFVEAASGAPVTPIVTKMSKRYKNVVNPDDVMAQYGADTFRLYEMAMGPLEASKPWNTKDIVGPFRFLQRLWRNCVDEGTGKLRVSEQAPSEGLWRLTHKTIAGVTGDINAIALHTAISKLIELNNELTREVAASGGRGAPREVVEVMAKLLAPFAPHIAEELWAMLGAGGTGAGGLVADAPWPTHDPALLVEASVEIAVQVQSKVRARVVIPAGSDNATTERLVLADAGVVAALAGKSVKKVIVVPGKMVNILTG